MVKKAPMTLHITPHCQARSGSQVSLVKLCSCLEEHAWPNLHLLMTPKKGIRMALHTGVCHQLHLNGV